MTAREPGRSRRRAIALRVLALVGGCLVSVLLAEALLRVSRVWVGRHSDTMFTIIEHDDRLGWRLKPNLTATVDLVDVEGIPVRSNSAGFWDREFALAKPAGRCRVAFLGDSFTWGTGVREEERFTNLLEAANPEWESLNFGVPGYGTDQALLLWEETAARYRPDLVILTVYQNDYGDNMHQVRFGRPKPYFELTGDRELALRNVPVGPGDFWRDGVFNRAAPPYASLFPEPVQKRSRVMHWLAKHSDLARLSYTLLRVRSAAVKAREESPTAGAAASGDAEPTPAQRVQVRLLGAIVERLAGRVRESGGRFAVALAGDDVPQYGLQRSELKRAGIASLDVTTGVLARGLPGGRRLIYYQYSQHWTPRAHRAVADLIAERIREQALCGEGS